jgi:hypothetical protein
MLLSEKTFPTKIKLQLEIVKTHYQSLKVNKMDNFLRKQSN